MERLFSPCTRLHATLENQVLVENFRHRIQLPELMEQINLNVSTQELLSAKRAFTFADLYAMLLGNEDTVAWLSPHAFVAAGAKRGSNPWLSLDHEESLCCFAFRVDHSSQVVAVARSLEHLLEICDGVLRLLAASVVHSVVLEQGGSRNGSFINAPTLAYLMEEQCQSLKFLSLESLNLEGDHCRVLGAYFRPDLEIVMDCCRITRAGAIVLAEILGRNQGPTKLVNCRVDNFVLADGLRENSRLKVFRGNILNSDPEDRNREFLAIADAVDENKGLVHLNLRISSDDFCVNDETWGVICDSLKTHPTLEVLNLRSAFTAATAAPALLISKIQKLIDTMKVNVTLHTLLLHYSYSQHELYQESVIPYLKTNWFRPRLLAIQKTRPITYRAKVLGRALLSARTDTNRFWMLLSGNADVAIPSPTSVIAAAANLPTPATPTTAADTSTANTGS